MQEPSTLALLRSVVFRYGAALLVSAFTFACARTLLPPASAAAYPLFLLAVGVSAAQGGGAPALLTLALSGLAFAVLGLIPVHIPGFNAWLPLILFVPAALAIALFGEQVRRSQLKSGTLSSHAEDLLKRELSTSRRHQELLQGLDAIVWEAELTPEGSADLTRQHFTFVSDRAQGLLGYAPEQWRSEPGFCIRLVHPEDRDRLEEFCESLARGAGSGEHEYRIITADRSVIWIRDIIQCVPGESGSPHRLRGLMLDVTDRKTAEEALLKSEDWYRRIVDTAAEGILVVNSRGRVAYANRQLGEMLGYGVQDMVGFLVDEFLFEENRDETRRFLTRPHYGDREQRDIRLRCKNGNGLWVLMCCSPIKNDRGGSIGALAMVSDVTERRRAEDAVAFLARASTVLAASLDYQTILASVAGLVVPHLADTCIVDVLEEDGSIHRFARSERAGGSGAAPLECCFPPGMERPAPLRAVLGSGEAHLHPQVPAEVLEALAFGCGEWPSLLLGAPQTAMLVPLKARGRVVGAISILATQRPPYQASDLALAEDLARRSAVAIENARLFGEVQRADQRKDEFMAMLAHELRNPLGAVRNALEVVRLSEDDEGTRDRALRVLERQVRHQVRLVDDLLDVSRITRGKIVLQRNRLDLIRLLRDAAEDHRSGLERAGLTLKLQLPDAAVWVEGDPTRLAQVAGNLLQNAAKFTDPGGTISLEVELREEQEAVIRFRDTGIGIEPDMLGRVFDPFAQADRSLDRSRGGLGLGLALVRGLLELHGGEVTAHSSGIGHGSVFTVTLPVVDCEFRIADLPGSGRLSSASNPAPSNPQSPTRNSPSKRVLVVEDILDAAETMRDLLELSGFEVELAHNGPAGVAAVQRFRPDVVLCDIGLPGMDGYEVARQVRSEGGVQPVMVAITGYGQPDDRHRALDAGFDAHLVKPVSPDRILRLLKCEGIPAEELI